MHIGTKSVLYGAHCFFIHPWFVALAWWKLYRFRTVRDPYAGPVSLKDPRLWLAFFVHDLGYFGKPNMDGPEGEQHPLWGARFMAALFDGWKGQPPGVLYGAEGAYAILGAWGQFCLYHSRYLARRHQLRYSLLCVADKLAVALEPWWLYLPRVKATGEIDEYMALAGARNPDSKYAGEPPTKYESAGYDLSTPRAWCLNMQSYCREWAFAHRDGCPDTWTPTTYA